MSLRHKTFSAVRWTAISAVTRALLQLAQVAVLARLLVPEDYGLMAVVAVIMSFGGLFADLGLNSAYVQRKDVTPEQRSSLFWLNVMMSGVLTLFIILTSPLLATFFKDPRLTPLLMLSATTFVIGALGQQLRMTAEKMLEFRAVILLEITAAIFGFASAVFGALAGLGVYALVLGGIVGASAGTVLVWVFVAHGWRPYWRFRFEDVRSYLGFGGAMVGDGIVNNINRTIDLLLGGRMLAATQLGLYSVPRNLVLQMQYMVNPVITRVGFPLIAQVQDDIAQVRSIYLKTLNMTASTNAPLYIGLAFFSPEAVHVMLGAKWAGSVEFLRILALWGFLRSTGNPVGSLLLGMGRADLSFKWNLALLFIVPPLLWGGAHYGPAGLAWTMLGFSIVMFVPGWYILVRPICHAGLVEYSIAALRPLVISVISIAPMFFLVMNLENPLMRLVVGVGGGAPLYLVLSYAANKEWVSLLTELIGRRTVFANRD